MKTCTKCRLEKSLDEFSMKRGKPTARCKACHSAYQKAYYADPEKRAKHLARVARNNNRYRREGYGFSDEESYQEFRSRNNGMCEICQIAPSTALDHDHETGDPRGMLCAPCNAALGVLGDSVAGLERAIQYLTK